MEKFRVLCSPETLAPQGIEPNGGGALSSDYVSKLGSKEVSKILRNFTLTSKKACHCEDERSEDVAIAKSLSINEITTQSTIARNDKLRHPELVSGSQSEIHSTTFHKKGRRKVAFTLAEVLITLGIIGVVASLTLPSVITKYQKKQTLTQVKKAYSTLGQIAQRAVADNGPILSTASERFTAEEYREIFNTYWLPYLKDIDIFPEGECIKLNNNKCKYLQADKSGEIGYEVLTNVDNGQIFFSTTDGMTYFIKINDELPGYTRNIVIVDINGIKSPNRLGRDVFEFEVDFYKGIAGPFAATPPDWFTLPQMAINAFCRQTGFSCVEKIMRDGWKISDDYPW